MDPLGVFNVSASALYAERSRMNVIASNIANMHSTRTPEGGPYRRKDVVFSAKAGEAADGELRGVDVSGVVEDSTPPVMVYDPGHPDADKNGNVAMPNVNILDEMVNMMTASRAYEANINVFNISKGLITKALEIGK